MIITFYGEGCFKIQSGETTLLTDPFDNKSGLTPPRIKPDILIKTITPFPITDQILTQETGKSIYGPGEYNIKEADIYGFLLPKESEESFFKTVYSVKIEGISLCFLGHISQNPEPSFLEHLGSVDILFIPAGGEPFIDQKSAIKLIKQIEPKIIVPSFFKLPGLKRQSSDIKIFLEEFNHNQKTDPQEKLSIKKKEFNEIKSAQIIVLKP